MIVTAAGARASSAASEPALPAEELRLDPAVFRAGLKKLGLNDVLELHLRDFPPADEIARWLMMRDIRMAEFADRSGSQADRLRAADEANEILERLIAEHAGDPRRFEWRFELAHSLIYEQAEASLTRLLFHEPPRRDDPRLSEATRRAASLSDELVRDLEIELARIDALSAEEFESLKPDGYVEQLDRLSPRAAYLRVWANFYDALPRRDDDPVRASRLNAVREYVRDHAAVLTMPHEQSRVQVQVLLLAGMTLRALHDHGASRELLTRALVVADGLEEAERARVSWAISLAGLERARNDRDDGRFDDAQAALERFLRGVPAEDRASFGLRLAGALCERSVWRARADDATKKERLDQAETFRRKSWMALARLSEIEPARRDEVDAAVYAQLDLDAEVERLDPLEKCAAVAGLLREAQDQPEAVDERLDRARRIAEQFLVEDAVEAPSLTPHVLFNLALIHYQRGDLRSAADRFLETARDHPGFDRCYRAAVLAVELLAVLNRSPEPEEHRSAYREALELLLQRYPGTEAEGYWRFYLAQLLDESGEHAAAADHYALVDPGHEHYVESRFLWLRSLAFLVQDQASTDPDDLPSLRQQVEQIARIELEFAHLLDSLGEPPGDSERAASLTDLRARARVIAAEVLGLPQMDRPQAALERLRGFEALFPERTDLLGRVWRVRLLSLQRLGRLDEAIEAIPDYVQRDPQGAGSTLQSLFESMIVEAERLRELDDPATAQAKADLALLLARQLRAWALRRGEERNPSEVRDLRLQFAEACLLAGRFDEARSEFEALAADREGLEPPGEEGSPFETRLRFGWAEARFQLGHYAVALPDFNHIARTLSPREPMRWRALTRDLQCRTALGEPPDGIIKVIVQQKYLYPELGGPRIAAELEKLLSENRKKIGSDIESPSN